MGCNWNIAVSEMVVYKVGWALPERARLGGLRGERAQQID
jgi:hypothetical protein